MGSNKSAASAAVWNFAEKLSTQGTSFIIGIVLARLLSPEDFGIVGLASIFIAISNVFVEAGFGNALIRKQEKNDNDLTTALLINIFMALLVFVVLWFLAPPISLFFNEPLVVPLVRIAGFNLFVGAFGIVQQALLSSELQMKKQTVITLCSQIPAGLIAIILAYKGGGVYSLALQTLIATVIMTILLWTTSSWRPKGYLSLTSMKYLINFGTKLTGANLIGVTFDRIYSVLIGKYIGKSDLGYYTRGESLNNQAFSISNGMIQKLALPILSRYQNDVNQLTINFREIMKLLVMINAFMASLMVVEAEDIVTFLWTDKWINTASIFKILVLANLWVPIGSLSLILLQVVNRPDIVLKLEFPKKAIYVFIIYIGFKNGVIGLASSVVAINFIAACINMFSTRKYLKYNFIYQFFDIFKYIIIAFSLAFVIAHFITRVDSPLINIILMLVLFSAAYMGTLYALKDEIAIKYINKVILKFKR